MTTRRRRPPGDPNLLILCYHAVSESWPSVAAVSPGALHRQLRRLLGRGYRPRTLSDALAAPAGERTLVVSFDDAHRSVFERGRPVLDGLGVPGTVFVPTAFAAAAGLLTWSALGRWLGTPHEAELRCMSWDELRALAAAGWEVGSHTCSHPDLTAIGAEQARGELDRSRAACEAELQRPCKALAYPFGAYDERVAELAREAGYENAVTLGQRLLEPLGARSPYELPRQGVYRSTGRLDLALAASPRLRKMRNMRVYRAVGAHFSSSIR